MDSLINLGIGRFELDWGKLHASKNHSKLFCPSDIKSVEYFYYSGDSPSGYRTETKPGYGRKLRDLLRRLDLLGYTLAGCQRQYAQFIEDSPDYCKPVSFESFSKIIALINIPRIRIPDGARDYEPGEFASKAIFQDPEFIKSENAFSPMDEYSGLFYENLDPYITLRLPSSKSPEPWKRCYMAIC